MSADELTRFDATHAATAVADAAARDVYVTPPLYLALMMRY